MEANKQPKVEEIVISMGDGGREFITVPQGAVLSPITVVSSASGMQQWQTVKTSTAGVGSLQQQQQQAVRLTTADPNVITVNGTVLSPQQYTVQTGGQGGAVQTYYTTAPQATEVTAGPTTVTPTPIVVGRKSKAGPASRTIVQAVGGTAAAATAVSSANIIDMKNVTPLPQAVLQQVQAGNWTTQTVGTSQQPQTVNLISTDQGWSTIKLENGQLGTAIQASPNGKTVGQSTINASGLQFISTGPTTTFQPAAANAAATAQPQFVTVASPPGRKAAAAAGAGTIIETFKCEVCNQVFQSMPALQAHVTSIHEAPSTTKGKGGKKGAGGGQQQIHCEYKYSGGVDLDNTVTVLQSPAGQTIQLMPAQQTTTVQGHAGPITVMQPAANSVVQAAAATVPAAATSVVAQPAGMASAAGQAGQTFITAPAQPAIVMGKNGKIRKEKKRNWQCDTCMNRFSRKDHLAKHVSAVHMKVRPFECGTCGQKFSQKHHLRAHMLARHEDDKTAAKAFACQQCNKRFTRNDHLERHIESVHEKRKQFDCAVCSHQFARKHHLSKHILAVHAKVKPFLCHLCDQSFLQRHQLGSHIMSVHQPPVHEEEDGTKTFVCAICFHRFKRKDHLKTHVETVHEKARNYACQLCERRFGQKFHLAIHVSAVHEGKKPHACHLCTHKSARKSGLQRHLKTVHNILPPKQAAQQAAQQQQLMQIKQEVQVAAAHQPQTIQLQSGQHMQVVQLGPNGQITGEPIVVTPQQLASPGGGLPQGAQLVTIPANSQQAMSPQAVTVTVTPSGNVVSSQ